MKPLVLYHANCRDGQAAAWVAGRALPGAELVPVLYGSEPPIDQAKDREVYVIDFSWKRAEMRLLMDASWRTVVLDHHRTAEAELAGLASPDEPHVVIFDMERSGAGIAYDFFNGGEDPTFHALGRPWVVDYVEDRDLWRWALPQSREVNAYLSTLDYEPSSFDALPAYAEEAAKLGAGAMAAVRRYAETACGNAFYVDLRGWHVPSVTACQHNVSEVLEHLMDTHGLAPFVVGWWRRSDGLFQYSLRSRGEFDVSEVAKAFGGGGHRNAAGFQLPEFLFAPPTSPQEGLHDWSKAPDASSSR